VDRLPNPCPSQRRELGKDLGKVGVEHDAVIFKMFSDFPAAAVTDGKG
jgi:hypothetical protein